MVSDSPASQHERKNWGPENNDLKSRKRVATVTPKVLTRSRVDERQSRSQVVEEASFIRPENVSANTTIKEEPLLARDHGLEEDDVQVGTTHAASKQDEDECTTAAEDELEQVNLPQHATELEGLDSPEIVFVEAPSQEDTDPTPLR